MFECSAFACSYSYSRVNQWKYVGTSIWCSIHKPRALDCFLILKDDLEVLICQQRSYPYLRIMKSSQRCVFFSFSRINIPRYLILLFNNPHIFLLFPEPSMFCILLTLQSQTWTKILYLGKLVSTLIDIQLQQSEILWSDAEDTPIKKSGTTRTPSIKHCSGHSREYEGKLWDV